MLQFGWRGNEFKALVFEYMPNGCICLWINISSRLFILLDAYGFQPISYQLDSLSMESLHCLQDLSIRGAILLSSLPNLPASYKSVNITESLNIVDGCGKRAASMWVHRYIDWCLVPVFDIGETDIQSDDVRDGRLWVCVGTDNNSQSFHESREMDQKHIRVSNM